VVSFVGGTEGYKRKALGTGISLYGDSVGQTEVGLSTGTLRYSLKGLWRWSVSLCGIYVKGTWREGSLAGNPKGYLERALGTGISLHRGSVWETWKRFRLPGTLRPG
jgi:hypothetical protein